MRAVLSVRQSLYFASIRQRMNITYVSEVRSVEDSDGRIDGSSIHPGAVVHPNAVIGQVGLRLFGSFLHH
uniref:Uncharacterized protein n=1 Tax=Kalanchoe fedtschenkoi TaxID=63787 RepID=A0A7N0TFK0_KALFE